jgi:hypothetical protein
VPELSSPAYAIASAQRETTRSSAPGAEPASGAASESKHRCQFTCCAGTRLRILTPEEKWGCVGEQTPLGAVSELWEQVA